MVAEGRLRRLAGGRLSAGEAGLIAPPVARVMAEYNAEINRRLLTAAGQQIAGTDLFLVV
jgi:hypothetical protein